MLHRLVEDAYARQPDLVIFSGDATTLGVEEEFAHAIDLLQVGSDQTPLAMAVPGNHDYYTTSSVKLGLFERYFAPWQHGERVDDEIYPFARVIGPLYIVGGTPANGTVGRGIPPEKLVWTNCCGWNACSEVKLLENESKSSLPTTRWHWLTVSQNIATVACEI